MKTEIKNTLVQKIKKSLENYPAGYQSAAAREVVQILIEGHGVSLAPEVLRQAATLTGFDLSQLYRVLRQQLLFHREGEFVCARISLCKGVSCRLRGGDQVNKTVKNWLGMGAGETSIDGRFYLKEKRCMHRCHQAPVMMIDDKIFPEILPSRSVYLLQKASEKKHVQNNAHEIKGKNPYQIGGDKND